MIRVIKLGNRIYENIEPKYADQNGNEVWNIPNNIDKLKLALIDTVNWIAYQELKKTDWIIVKLTELGQLSNSPDKYKDILTKREQIREWSNQKQDEINSQQTIDDLIKVDLTLPSELKFIA